MLRYIYDEVYVAEIHEPQSWERCVPAYLYPYDICCTSLVIRLSSVIILIDNSSAIPPVRFTPVISNFYNPLQECLI